ncbi:MAG: hypothetical protein FWH12_01995 [Treponema sp.]|nr:hypothetical protein [Treponema sp.]
MKLPALKEIVEERKEKAITDLSDGYARNRLPLEEYERLVEYINKIESERELVVVERIVAEHCADPGAEPSMAKPAPEEEDDDEEDYSRHQGYGSGIINHSVLSARVYSGPVQTGSQFINILGSSHIMIRKKDLSKRRTRLQVMNILGETSISIESGIRIINKAIPVLGNSSINQRAKKQAGSEEGIPELEISGVVILGDLSVKLLKE